MKILAKSVVLVVILPFWLAYMGWLSFRGLVETGWRMTFPDRGR